MKAALNLADRPEKCKRIFLRAAPTPPGPYQALHFGRTPKTFASFAGAAFGRRS